METIHYFKSPLGWMEITTTTSTLKQLKFVSKMLPSQNKMSTIAQKTAEALRLYFSNPKSVPSVPLLPEGTAFQKKIWKLYSEGGENIKARSCRSISRATGISRHEILRVVNDIKEKANKWYEQYERFI